jgi:hypothetical protein
LLSSLLAGVNPAAARQADVRQDDVGLVASCIVDGLGHHFKAGAPLQETLDAQPDDFVVVNKHDAMVRCHGHIRLCPARKAGK